MARPGIEHAKATIPFELVEQARDFREHEGLTRRAIKELLWIKHGLQVSMNTLDDWLYYRTRVYG